MNLLSYILCYFMLAYRVKAIIIILLLLNVSCKSYFHCCNVFEIEDGKSPSRTIRS